MILTVAERQQSLSLTSDVCLCAESYGLVSERLRQSAFVLIVVARCQSIKNIDFGLDVGMLLEEL
jgi:hypothetical protein